MNKPEYYDIMAYCPCIKKYSVIRRQHHNDVYQGDVGGIVGLYYSLHPDSNFINITVYGTFHETYPNPPHLTVEIHDKGISTGRMHFSLTQNGVWTQQLLPNNLTIS